MQISGLTQAQQRAVVDLLLAGMYVDHNLRLAEDDCIQRVLGVFSFGSEYERQQFLDSAFARADRGNEPDQLRATASAAAAQFPDREMRRKVYRLLEQLLASDGAVSDEEGVLLSTVRDIFQL